jgi:hypothetical protein
MEGGLFDFNSFLRAPYNKYALQPDLKVGYIRAKRALYDIPDGCGY